MDLVEEIKAGIDVLHQDREEYKFLNNKQEQVIEKLTQRNTTQSWTIKRLQTQINILTKWRKNSHTCTTKNCANQRWHAPKKTNRPPDWWEKSKKR